MTQHYGAPSSTLEQSFEYQNYDLVNSERKQDGLNTLSYSKMCPIRRNHSEDMVKQNYFDHNNLDGESPFDRLKDDDIDFNAAKFSVWATK